MDDDRPDEPSEGEEPLPAADTEESEEGVPIGPDSLRVDSRVALEMFGDLYTDTTTHGPAQFGNYNTMFFGKQLLDPIIGKLTDIEDLLMVYVPTGADEHLDDLLAQRSTVCLTGPRNSGRYSTARAALGRRYKAGQVYEIVLPTDVLPEVLVAKPDRLPADSGFVLRLPGDGHNDVARKLAALFRRRSSTLILIKDEDRRRGDRHGAEVLHQAPDPVNVFRSHLAAALPGEGFEGVERYLIEEDVQTALKAAYGPKEAVAIARAIAKEPPRDDEALHAILERSQPKRRERADRILLPESGEVGAKGRRASQHERAFRLSYAVFYRRPLHYVFEAADWLLREIDSAALRPDWGRMALQHPVHDLLGQGLKQDWRDGRESGKATAGASRTAWIRDPGLRGAIIDVAWHEFDGTRNSVLRWLDRLVKDGDEVMRRAAAETAGLLIHHDFTRVHEDLVDGWAGSRKPTVRQAAAWTMTLSEMAGDVRPMVLAQLSEWCSRGNNYHRDTAARVYASGLQQVVPAWSLFDLGRIADDKLQKQRYAVAEAINQLYRPELAGWILAEMVDWARVPARQTHAARALLTLAAKVEPDATDGRPDLLAQLAEGVLDAGDLGHLWLIAFLEPATAPEAARVLARWIRHTDAAQELREPIAELLSAITTVRALRKRVEFYLKKTPELRNGLPGWVEERSRDL